MAQRKIDSSAFNRVFWTDNAGIKYRPIESLKKPKDNALRNRRFI